MVANDNRKEVHRLIDEIPESELHAAKRFLEYLRDPLSWKLRQAPEDDEPVTEEDEQAISIGLDALRSGETVDDAELRTNS